MNAIISVKIGKHPSGAVHVVDAIVVLDYQSKQLLYISLLAVSSNKQKKIF